MIEITIIDDAEFELMEIFNISLIRVTGGGRLGEDVVVTVVIPQNDSPFGVFGFEEKTVSEIYQEGGGVPSPKLIFHVIYSRKVFFFFLKKKTSALLFTYSSLLKALLSWLLN